MKKIFTLLASFMIAIAAFSQYGQGNHKDYGKDEGYNKSWNKKDNDRFNDRYHFSKRERDMKIAEINREYNYKIQSVMNKSFMSRHRKQRLIRELDEQRKDEIRLVYIKFNNRRDRYDDDDRDDRKRNW